MIDLRSGDTILFVFPHPDDDVFVGGTLSMLVRAGVRVHAAWMTSGGYDGLDTVREDEMRRAMDVASVEHRHLLRMPDGGLVGALDEACERMRQLIDDVAPAVLVGPAFEGGHADHDATSFIVAEGNRRARRGVRLFEYPCYAPDASAAGGLRLNAFQPRASRAFHFPLDEAALQCKRDMAAAYASQKEVFDLLGWQPSEAREPFRESPRDRDHRHPPCPDLDSYAHWFNWRSTDRFAHLAAAVAASRAREEVAR